MKLHPLDISDIEILEDMFPFVNTDVVHNLELEKNDYNIANADAGHDLWAFWYDNRLKLPFWYNVATGIALVQPSSAFMERVLSILRACLDERQETCYSDRIQLGRRPCSSTTGEENNFFLYQGRPSFCCCALYPCDIVVWLQFHVLTLVFQYCCSGVNVERVRGPTVSLGAVGPREFDLLTPAAQHK